MKLSCKLSHFVKAEGAFAARPPAIPVALGSERNDRPLANSVLRRPLERAPPCFADCSFYAVAIPDGKQNPK
jgi:hypothetical protein